jgi:very-short-patch-repair endonuclease
MPESLLADALRHHLRTAEFPAWVEEHRFHPTRKWRFDFAWPANRLACEVEGGVYTNGRHTRGAGFTADCEKYNEAAADGWTVIRVTAEQIDNGQATAWLQRVLAHEAPPF